MPQNTELIPFEGPGDLANINCRAPVLTAEEARTLLDSIPVMRTVKLKGGEHHDVPANHNLDEYLEAHIKGVDLEADPKGPLFRTAVGKSDALTRRPLSQADAYRLIRWRAS
jgi:hypothetical protein